jgi:hypothetical protein
VVALAMTHVTAEKRKLHILTGGHINEITRSQCSWNVFPEYKANAMEANAIADTPAFPSEREPLPCVDERLDAGSLGSGSAEAPGVELMRADCN